MGAGLEKKRPEFCPWRKQIHLSCGGGLPSLEESGKEGSEEEVVLSYFCSEQ